MYVRTNCRIFLWLIESLFLQTTKHISSLIEILYRELTIVFGFTPFVANVIGNIYFWWNYIVVSTEGRNQWGVLQDKSVVRRQYFSWCKFVFCNSSIWLHLSHQSQKFTTPEEENRDRSDRNYQNEVIMIDFVEKILRIRDQKFHKLV